MARNNKAFKGFRRAAAKTLNFLKLVVRKIWGGMVYIWKRPLIVSAILLVLAIFLFNLIIKQTFKPYLNCAYLVGNKLGMPSFFCDGYDVKVLGSTIFSIPGLRGVMDPPLELVRKIVSWSVAIFFAFLSLYLTIMIDNLKSFVRLVTFNKEEWKKFMASLRTWLLIFVSFSFLFYFTVIR
jgi:hypothetical protein